MKKLICFLFIPILLISCTIAQNEKDIDISGKWTGKLSAQGINLRIVFNFKQENGQIKATLDSPDQGAKGIPVEKVTLTNDSLVVDVKAVMGKYIGVTTSDSTFKGTWYQGGMSLPLDITKQKYEEKKPIAEVKSPYYDSKDVKFRNEKANVTLAGTLTIPKNGEKFPAVILVSGSGAQNRDEELMEQKPFYRIADYLSSHGIAVLRYDDRGVFESTGNFAKATTLDFASDAEAAFQFLKTQKEIIPSKIGIVGHSEGGCEAPVVAAENSDVDFIILLAGCGITGEEILITQTDAILKNNGLKNDTIAMIVKTNQELYSIINKQPYDSLAYQEIKLLLDRKNFPEEAKELFLKSAGTYLSPWFRGFIKFDPKIYLNKVKCPVLAINGSNDLQVLSQLNLSAIERTLKNAGHKNYKIVEMKGYNHLFQKGTSGKLSEYGDLSKPAMDDEVLAIMEAWIKGIVK